MKMNYFYGNEKIYNMIWNPLLDFVRTLNSTDEQRGAVGISKI